MENLTFDSLPQAITKLFSEVCEIKKLLIEGSNGKAKDTDSWLGLTELCNYHPDKPTKPTVYGWVNAGLIPVHKGGKKLRFLKSEIDRWLLTGNKKTAAEIQQEANHFLSKKKK